MFFERWWHTRGRVPHCRRKYAQACCCMYCWVSKHQIRRELIQALPTRATTQLRIASIRTRHLLIEPQSIKDTSREVFPNIHPIGGVRGALRKPQRARSYALTKRNTFEGDTSRVKKLFWRQHISIVSTAQYRGSVDRGPILFMR